MHAPPLAAALENPKRMRGNVNFDLFSKYWAAPLSNVIVVLVGIIILYPVIWRVSVTQLSKALDALNAAKELPKTIADLNSASDKLVDVNTQISGLKEKLSDLDAITTQLEKANQQLEIANRQLADLEKRTEEVPPELTPPQTTQQTPEAALASAQTIDNWTRISTLWFDVKDALEKKIAGIGDGRISRKYNSIPRYTYDDITSFLERDGLLNNAKRLAVNQMDRTFRSLRNRRTNVTPEIVQDFENWHRLIMN